MTLLSSMWTWLDRHLGRGSYPAVRAWLAPYQEYSYYAYAQWIRLLVSSETRWVDAGCGHQSLESRLGNEEREIVDTAQLVVGCDGLWSSVSAHRSIKTLVTCDISSLPFADESFSLVTLNMVAEHLKAPEVVFAEIARILEDGGVLLIHTPNAAGYNVKVNKLTWRLLPKKCVYGLIRFLEHREPEDVFPTFYRANTKKRIGVLAANCGMREQEFRFVEGRPCFYFFAPLAVLEILLCRCLRALGRADLCAGVILATYRKRAVGRGRIGLVNSEAALSLQVG